MASATSGAPGLLLPPGDLAGMLGTLTATLSRLLPTLEGAALLLSPDVLLAYCF